MSSKKIILHIIIGIIISVLFLFLAFRKTDFTEVFKSFRHTDLQLLALATLSSLIIFALRAFRWHFLMKSIKSITFLSLFSSTMVGFFANHTLPLRIGEFVRAYSLSRKERISTSECFGTIITERIFDIFTLFLILIPLLSVSSISQRLGQVGLTISLFLALAIIFFIYLYLFGMNLLNSQKIIHILPEKIYAILFNLVKGLKSLKNPRDLMIVIILSSLIWIASGLVHYLLLLAFQIHHLPVWSGFVILIFIAFGVALPSSPGYIGSYHYFAMISLEIFGISKEIALGYAILSHGFQTLFIVIVGLFFLFSEGLKISDALSKSQNTFPDPFEKTPSP